jgi:hypothetical protein
MSHRAELVLEHDQGRFCENSFPEMAMNEESDWQWKVFRSPFAGQ